MIDLLKTPFIYINLDEDEEKKNSILSKLKSVGVDQDLIYRIQAHRQDPPHVGILASQIKALKLGLKLGIPFVILEDDVQIQDFESQIPLPDPCDACYLGVSSWGFDPGVTSLARVWSFESGWIPGKPGIAKISGMYSAHAILYCSKTYVEELIQNLSLIQSGNPFTVDGTSYDLKYYGSPVLPCDVVMAIMQSHYQILALTNPIFYQGEEHEYCTKIELKNDGIPR